MKTNVIVNTLGDYNYAIVTQGTTTFVIINGVLSGTYENLTMFHVYNMVNTTILESILNGGETL